MSEAVAEVWRPKYNVWAIALTVTLATFMEVLDTSIANVALPHIAGNLSAGQDESTWVLTSYLVANAVVLPVSAWLATRLGRKRFYMGCVVLFGISSLLCGFAPNLGALIFFRVLQGLGGGGLAPSEQAILADTFEPKKRGVAFAVYGMAVVLAPAIGPTLGGYITDSFSWRWIFLINVPVALVSLYLTNKLVEDPPHLEVERKKATRIDYVGFGLLGLGLGSLQVMLDKGEREDWFHSDFIVSFAVITVVSLVVAIIWEYYEKEPIIDIRLFKNRTFTISCIMMFMLGLALFGTTVLLPQMLQTLMGYSAQQAGMALSVGGLVVMMLMPLVGRLIGVTDPRYMLAFGWVVTAAALWHMTGLSLEMDFRYVLWLRVIQALGMAFLFVPINTLSYTDIPMEKNNAVSGLTNLMRNIGGSVGISVVLTMLSQRSQAHQHDLVEHATLYDPTMRATIAGISQALRQSGVAAADATQQAYLRVYLNVQRQAAVLAYLDVLYIFAIISALMVPLAFLMKRRKKTSGSSSEVMMH